MKKPTIKTKLSLASQTLKLLTRELTAAVAGAGDGQTAGNNCPVKAPDVAEKK